VVAPRKQGRTLPAMDQAMSINEVAVLLGVSRSTALRVVARPGFPAARRPSCHRRWLRSEVLDWFEGRKETPELLAVVPANLRVAQPRGPRRRKAA
jgi:excisionase family DNA binding protein